MSASASVSVSVSVPGLVPGLVPAPGPGLAASAEDPLAALIGADDAGAEDTDRGVAERLQLDAFLRVNHEALSNLQQDRELARLSQNTTTLYADAAVLRRDVWIFAGASNRCRYALTYAPGDDVTTPSRPGVFDAQYLLNGLELGEPAPEPDEPLEPFCIPGYMLARRPEESLQICFRDASRASLDRYMSLARLLVEARAAYDESAEEAKAAEAAKLAAENSAVAAAIARVAETAARLADRASQVRELSDRMVSASRRNQIIFEVPRPIAEALRARDASVGRLFAIANATLEGLAVDPAFGPDLVRVLEAGRAFEARATMLPSYCALARWAEPDACKSDARPARKSMPRSFYDGARAKTKDVEIAAAVCEVGGAAAVTPGLLAQPARDNVGALVRELAKIPRVFLLLERMPAEAAAAASQFVAGAVAHANATGTIAVFSRCIGHSLLAPLAFQHFAGLAPALRALVAPGLVATACRVENGFVCSAQGEPRKQATVRLNQVSAASPFVFAEPALRALGELEYIRALPAARDALAEFVGGAPVLAAIFASAAPLFLTGSAIAAAWSSDRATTARMYPTHVFADPAAVRAWAAAHPCTGMLPPVCELYGTASGRLFGQLPGSEPLELVYGADVDIYVDTGALCRARNLAATTTTHQSLLDETVAALFGRLAAVGNFVLRQVPAAVSHRWQIVPVGRQHGRRCFEVYSSTFSRAMCHHVAPVRGVFGRFDGAGAEPEFRLAASAVFSLHSRRLDDLNFFAGLRPPRATIVRYQMRGFELSRRLVAASPALAEAAKCGQNVAANMLAEDAAFIAATIPADC